MKYSFFCLIFTLLCKFTFAQPATDTLPNYVKQNSLPAFRLLTTDSVIFSNKNLPIDKFKVIIYFSPDCSHCKAKAKALADNIDSVSNAVFIWASYHPVDELKIFAGQFGLSKYSYVKVGRDINYTIPVYFKATVTPYIAIYDTKGVFVKEFRKGAMFKDIISVLKNR